MNGPELLDLRQLRVEAAQPKDEKIKPRFADEQIIQVIKGQEVGEKTVDVGKRYGICQGTFYKYKSKYEAIGLICCRKPTIASIGVKVPWIGPYDPVPHPYRTYFANRGLPDYPFCLAGLIGQSVHWVYEVQRKGRERC